MKLKGVARSSFALPVQPALGQGPGAILGGGGIAAPAQVPVVHAHEGGEGLGPGFPVPLA